MNHVVELSLSLYFFVSVFLCVCMFVTTSICQNSTDLVGRILDLASELKLCLVSCRVSWLVSRHHTLLSSDTGYFSVYSWYSVCVVKLVISPVSSVVNSLVNSLFILLDNSVFWVKTSCVEWKQPPHIILIILTWFYYFHTNNATT